ncbi:MAG: glycosyltransferase [Acetobacteraceae bacterium]|nr:glycosyltransferase [Acetobacteraceae bacterium]
MHLGIMKLGIGVPTFRRPGSLRRCLQRLRDLTSTPHELIVADDGSEDETAEIIGSFKVRRVTGRNMGVCWNKNRALFALHEVLGCDVVILIEDDTFPNVQGWERNWIAAAQGYGHANLVGDWFKSQFVQGAGTVEDPVFSRQTSGQVTAFSGEALAAVGYLDTRFRGYGFGHVDHTVRMIRAGYGGRFEDNRALFLLIEGSVTVTAEHTNRNEAQLAANKQLMQKNLKEPLFRLPWSSDAEKEQLCRELRKVPKARQLDLDSLAEPITCSVDELANGTLRGWASAGRDAPPARLRLLIDGVEVARIACDEDRPDVWNSGFALKSGFRVTVPRRFHDGRLHMIQLRSERGRSVSFLVDGIPRVEAAFRLGGEHGEGAARLVSAVAAHLKRIGAERNPNPPGGFGG